jgi:hypothetical protein
MSAAMKCDGLGFMGKAPGICSTIDAGCAWSMSRSL